MFIREEWLTLYTLLKAGLSGQFCSEKLLQLGQNIF